MIQKHDQIEGWSRSLGWLRKDIGSHGNQLALLALGTFALSLGASHPGKAQNLLGSLNPGSRRGVLAETHDKFHVALSYIMPNLTHQKAQNPDSNPKVSEMKTFAFRL